MVRDFAAQASMASMTAERKPRVVWILLALIRTTVPAEITAVPAEKTQRPSLSR